MKNTLFKSKILSVVMLALSFFAGAFAFASTEGNVIAFAATSYVSSFVLQQLTGVSLSMPGGSLFCTLAHVKAAPCGSGNVGGGHRMWLAPADQFTAPYGHTATNGTIIGAPTMEVGFAGWTQIDVTDNAVKIDQMLKGNRGYQTWEAGFELKVPGDNPAQTAAIEKFINTPVVAIIELSDLQRKTIGSSVFPLTFEATHTTGENGTSERGWTLKAKKEGIAHPSYFIESTVAITVAPTT